MTVIDGVERYPSLDLSVLVVGGGVGGLLTALECWRKGCDVRVLEKEKGISAIGDYFTIPPSGVSTFKYYPTMHADYHENVYDCSISVWRPNGSCVKTTFPEWVREGREKSAAPDMKISFIKRRPVFAKMLLDQCNRLGIPVHFGQPAQKVIENDSSIVVETTTGQKYEAEVCLSSDGIESGFAPEVCNAPVLDSGYSAARVTFHRSDIKSGSPAEDLLKTATEQPEFRTYLGNDLHLILFLTKDWLALVYTHESDGKSAESWYNLRNSDFISKHLEESTDVWDPAVIDFLNHIPEKVVDWGLRFRDPVEQWTSDGGRLAKLGDSAHAFLPTAGNGAVQACEDAITVAECLRLGGKENVPWAMRVYNKLRFQRTSVLQQSGFVNREELHNADLDAIEANPDVSDVGFFKIGSWVWAHDAEAYTREKFHECLSHVQNGTPFRNTNLPPGHVYKPWTMASENERMAAQIPSDLKENGYWGV